MAGTRQFDEARVREAALELFWRKGLSATSMLDLAEATGVHRGSLYNAYGSKETIFLLAFDAYADRFLMDARLALDKPDARHSLQAFFKVAINNMIGGSPARGCLTTRIATEAEGSEPLVRENLRKLLDSLEELVSSALSSPQARRRLSLSPDRAARLVVTFTRGLAVMERLLHDEGRLHEAASALIDVLLASPLKAPAKKQRATKR